MQHRVFAKTDVGCRYPHNEDAHLIDPRLGLYIVCDGVGGQAAGEIASNTACKTIQHYLLQNYAILEKCRQQANLFNREQASELVKNAIRTANEQIYQMSQQEADKRGMACTVALVLIIGPHAIVAHAGDSRVYLVREESIYQLTEDHSAVVEQLKKGLITVEQARSCRYGSLITRALGSQKFLEPDTLFMELMGHDRFLICSDGLSGYVDDEEIHRHFRKLKGNDLLQRMITLVLERKGHDNITAVTIEVGESDPASDAEVVRKFEILKKISLFQYLNYMEVMKVLNMTSIATYATGDLIIHEGEVDSRLFILLNGAVRVLKQEQVLAELGAGAFFGEMSLIDRAERSADVMATEPANMIVMERDHFVSLITREPRLSIKLLWPMCRELNHRLRQTSAELAWARSEQPPRDETEDALNFLADQASI